MSQEPSTAPPSFPSPHSKFATRLSPLCLWLLLRSRLFAHSYLPNANEGFPNKDLCFGLTRHLPPCRPVIDPYSHYHDLPASDQQHLNIDALATAITTSTTSVWSQEPTHHPSQHPNHALYVATGPANLFPYTTATAWQPGYVPSELHQWNPYQAGTSSHVLPMPPYQPPFTNPGPSTELSATWQPPHDYGHLTTNVLNTSGVTTRQNSLSPSSWPGTHLGRASSANDCNPRWLPIRTSLGYNRNHILTTKDTCIRQFPLTLSKDQLGNYVGTACCQITKDRPRFLPRLLRDRKKSRYRSAKAL